jgi:hypothetical protein
MSTGLEDTQLGSDAPNVLGAVTVTVSVTVSVTVVVAVVFAGFGGLVLVGLVLVGFVSSAL